MVLMTAISDRVRAIAQAMNLDTVIWSRVNATMTFDTGGERSSFPFDYY
jgi:hypothetical protein